MVSWAPLPLFEDRFSALLPLKIDEWGMVVAADDVTSHRRAVVRRLNPDRRRDPMAVAALRAEVEYGTDVDDHRFPSPDLLKFDDREFALMYQDVSGTRLDWLLADVERHGYTFAPGAALAMLEDVLFAAEAVQRERPPSAFGRADWGHGELLPSNILVDAHGQARLITCTLCVCGVAAMDAPEESGLFHAADAGDGTASATADVYALGVILAQLILGSRAVQHGASLSTFGADIQRLYAALVGPDTLWPDALGRALAPAHGRILHAGALRQVLEAMAPNEAQRGGAIRILDALDTKDPSAALAQLAASSPPIVLRPDPAALDRVAPLPPEAWSQGGERTGGADSDDSTLVPKHDAWRDDVAPTDPVASGNTNEPTVGDGPPTPVIGQ